MRVKKHLPRMSQIGTAATKVYRRAAAKGSLEEAAVNRPGRKAGIGMAYNREPQVRYKTSVPVLQTSNSLLPPPRPYGRGY
jgi:hypothetical protein